MMALLTLICGPRQTLSSIEVTMSHDTYMVRASHEISVKIIIQVDKNLDNKDIVKIPVKTIPKVPSCYHCHHGRAQFLT